MQRFARPLGLVLLTVIFLSGSTCSNGGKQHSSPPSSTSAEYGNTGAANGGPSAPASPMDGSASTLANLIIDYRQQAGLSPVVMASDTLAGVAQWQADDMSANGYIGLVGSDGEDALTRLANSGYTNAWAGVIATGISTDPQTVFQTLQTDSSAAAILLNNSGGFTSIGVGYSNGYWMVILGGSGTSGTTPAAPTLSGTPGASQIGLSWSTSTGATSYTINRGTASGGETSYATGITGTTYTDTAVTNGTAYFYTVNAVNSAGTSSPSNEVSATPTGTVTVPATTTLWASASASGVLLWWNTSPTATGYSVYRGTASGSETFYWSGGTATSWEDTAVVGGTTYYYTVEAVNSAGSSAPSNEVSATLTATASQTTTLTVASATAASSTTSQVLTLTATVTSPSATVNGGQVTFTIFDSNDNQVGMSATSGTVSGGSASATWTLPGNAAAGTYTIMAVYSGTGGFLSSNGSNSLIVAASGTETVNLINIDAGGWTASFQAGGTPGAPGSGSFTQPATATAPTTYMNIVSQPGDYIGQGQTYNYTASQITSSTATNGQALQVADYSGATRYPFNGSGPGLNFSGMGRGSNTLTGEFVIWELAVSNGQIVSLAIDFVQHSEGAPPALTGTIRINSSYE